MKFNQYPDAIAGIERQILKLTQDARRLQETLNTIANGIDRAIAFDPELKNDTQRKTKRTELLAENLKFQSAMTRLTQTNERRESLEIDLSYYRAQFSILKLEYRDRISQAEAKTA
jgi:hypothetical protein